MSILLQDDTNGDEHPVAYYSKAHSPAERNYMTYDREFLAIILSVLENGDILLLALHTRPSSLRIIRTSPISNPLRS